MFKKWENDFRNRTIVLKNLRNFYKYEILCFSFGNSETRCEIIPKGFAYFSIKHMSYQYFEAFEYLFTFGFINALEKKSKMKYS
jgi:hypothetical protein